MVADHFPRSDAYYNHVLTLWTRLGISTVFASPSVGELLPDWGRMRKFTLSLMHAFCRLAVETPTAKGAFRALLGLSLGMALTLLAGAATSAQQQLLEQVRLGEATHREDLSPSVALSPELIDPTIHTQVIAARFSAICCAVGIATGHRSYF